ncbi:fumarylacetoacetate hydrolase family protein [Acidovorax cavernicola]|uniref:4-hydroxyphenylacetate isomerase n=1 Tax=Acidovorax cavernicola TaxID=1675792 RepID=A0A9X8D4U2_9BURK|nr:fumarylacetoacetate hydrolase family protein [Acidovorax cavernicola]RIX79633.1 4-hydroxyphenylacetate isomerase [Acidovorax cavernicola]
MSEIRSTAAIEPQPPTVYGVLLNDRATHQRMEAAFHGAPYKAPPKAPVLYIKPVNTHVAPGAQVRVPADPGVVQVNPTLGLVLGRAATRVGVDDALTFVAGCRIACDLSLPHESVYRPAIRQRCRDGFLPMSEVLPLADSLSIEQLQVRTFVNEVEVDRRDFSSLVRPLAQLLADVTAFMTLDAGDVMLLGGADRSPLARAGDVVRVEVEGLGSLSFQLVAESVQGDQA